MKFEICSSCKEPTNNYTWLRQRILCRHCWEIKCHDEVMTIPHSPVITLCTCSKQEFEDPNYMCACKEGEE